MRKFIARILCFCVGVSSLFAFGGCTNRAYTRELIDALENNDMKKFTRMVNYGFNLDARPLPRILSDNAVNRPPLVVAVINANFEAVKILIEAGANPNVSSIDSDHTTPLHAALFGCTGAYVQDDEELLNTYYEIAYYLIEKGADINKETYYKHTPLSILTLRYDGREEGYNLFLYLLEKGAKIDAGYKGHAIFGACSNINSFPMAQYLFENYEIDVNMRSRLTSQHTLLMETVPPHGCSPVMCQYLLDKGADKTLKDANGKTAYDLAIEQQEFLLNKGYGEENEFLVEVNTLVELLK